MIEIKTLTPEDKGRWVVYRDYDGTESVGRLKSWSDSRIFVVFKCNSLWVDYLNYVGEGCKEDQLTWKHEDESDKQVVVIFRKFKDDKDVIALFVELPERPNSWYDCLSYMHIGQHGAAHIPTVMENSDPIKTYYGYRDLMAELVSIGYNVCVADTLTMQHKKSLREAAKKWQINNSKL